MPSLLIGVHCRLCRALIPHSIASQLGREDTGYLCERCATEDIQKVRALGKSAEEFWVKDVYQDMGDMIAPPCAICDTIEGNERVFDDYEGQKAFMCIACSDKYLRQNRDKIRGTLLEWQLKLR